MAQGRRASKRSRRRGRLAGWVVIPALLLAALALAGASHALPDLRLALVPDAAATDGSAVGVNVTLINAGDAASPNVTVVLALDGNPTDPPLEYGALAPGASASLVPRFVLPCGFHNLSASADAGGLVTESDESNNNATTVAPVNPAALFSWSLDGELGAYAATLNASASHGCQPLTYTWDVPEVGRLHGEVVSFAAPSGNLSVRLTAISAADARLASLTTMVVEVPNAPPLVTARALFPAPLTGLIVGLVVEASDPDGRVESYAIDLGDGTNTTSLSNASDHKYAQPGAYTIAVRATDNLGASAEAAVTVEVLNRPPEARAEPPYWYGEAGRPLVLNASASRDPEGGALTYAWDFGDGSTAAGPTASHTYPDPGSYSVRLTVTDAHGASHQVTVRATVLAPQDEEGPAGNLLTAGVLMAIAVFTAVYIVSVRRRPQEPPAKPPRTEGGEKRP